MVRQIGDGARFRCAKSLKDLKDRIAQTYQEEARLRSRLPKIPMGKPEYWVKFSIGVEFDHLVLWYRGDVVTGACCSAPGYARLDNVVTAAKWVGLRVPARWDKELRPMIRSYSEVRHIVSGGRWANGPKQGCASQTWWSS